MLVTKYCSTRRIALFASVLAAIQPLTTQSASESDRLEKLERAVEQLQKRNAELEAEVSTLKKRTAAVPEGKFKTKVTYDGKTYVEKHPPTRGRGAPGAGRGDAPLGGGEGTTGGTGRGGAPRLCE